MFSSQRAMEGFLNEVSELREQLLVQGDKPVIGWWKSIANVLIKDSLGVLVGLQSFAEGLDLKGDYLSQGHI